MKNTAKIIFLMLFAATLSVQPPRAAAEVRITVSKKFARKTVIAVPSFERKGGDSKLSSTLAMLLRSDLDASGYFTTVKKQKFVDEVERDDRKTGRFDVKEWATLRAEMVLKADYMVRGNSLSATCRLYSVKSGANTFAKAYSGDLSAATAMVHAIANDVIKAVTGEVGLCGSQIAFVSDMSGHKEIYIMELGGVTYRQITRGKDISLFPDWTPDKKNLVFTSYIRGFPELFIMNLASRRARALASFPGLNAFGDVSPDGREILLVLSKAGNPEIYRMNMLSGNLTRLTRTSCVESSPCWSPDGRQIAFVSDKTGSPQIYVMDSWGKGDPKRLTMKGRYNTKPDWAPEGDKIAYCSRVGGFELRMIDLKTREEISLPRSGSDEDPSWAPDSRHLVYSSERGRKRDLYIMDVYEQAPTRITRGKGNFSAPAWSP
ncbi:MAG: Tol-Pal system beta propeller repeat protein TolB [bacterium]